MTTSTTIKCRGFDNIPHKSYTHTTIREILYVTFPLSMPLSPKPHTVLEISVPTAVQAAVSSALLEILSNPKKITDPKTLFGPIPTLSILTDQEIALREAAKQNRKTVLLTAFPTLETQIEASTATQRHLNQSRQAYIDALKSHAPDAPLLKQSMDTLQQDFDILLALITEHLTKKSTPN